MGNENQIIIRRNNQTLHIVFADGFKLTSEQIESITNPRTPVDISDAVHGMTNKIGTIKNLTVWNRALSSEELCYLTGGKLTWHKKLMNWFNRLIRKR